MWKKGHWAAVRALCAGGRTSRRSGSRWESGAGNRGPRRPRSVIAGEGRRLLGESRWPSLHAPVPLVPPRCPVPASVSPSPEPPVHIPQRWAEEGVSGAETPRRDLGWGARGAALYVDRQPPALRPLPVSLVACTWPHPTGRELPAGPPRARALAPCRASGQAPGHTRLGGGSRPAPLEQGHRRRVVPVVKPPKARRPAAAPPLLCPSLLRARDFTFGSGSFRAVWEVWTDPPCLPVGSSETLKKKQSLLRS